MDQTMLWAGWMILLGIAIGWFAGTRLWRKKVKNLTEQEKKILARMLGLSE